MVRTGRASFAQERLYFLNQLQPGNPAYVVAFGVHLHGALRPEALRAALLRVTARHEALRTTFAPVDGVLVQRVADSPQAEIEIEAGEWADRDTQEGFLRALVAEQARRAFALDEGPVLRAYLRSWGPDEHTLAVLVHHIACDGWSVGLLLRDLAAEYHAALAGADDAGHAEPAESYLAYAQRQRAAWERDDSGLDFWRTTLRDAPQLALLTDFPRPSVLGNRGAVLRLPVDAGLVDRLTAWARERGATLFAVTLAAYAAVLSRYARQDEVVIGVPVANRMDEAEERLVGCLVNTLPIRLDLTGRPRFAELVDRARRASMAAFANQDVPFEEIVRATVGERQLSHAPLFQTSLTVQNFPFAFPDFDGVKLTEVDVEVDVTKFDVGLTLDVSTGAPFLRAEYSTELFTEETVATLLRHYLTFLRSIVDEPDAEPSMVDAAERRLLTEGVNPPLTAEPVDYPSVLRRFDEHVARTPDAVAVRHRDTTVTYAELDRWAGRIAAGLADLGIGHGDRVGLLLGRSPAVIAAIVGAWRLGAVYVPLDPEYPRQRLDLIAASAGLRIMLAEPGTADTARALTAGRGIPLADPHTLDGVAETPRAYPAGDDPAYVIYTSGSTGAPKGVLVGHGGLAALNTPTPAGLDVTAADGWLAASSFSFDASVWEMWGALTTGGRLVVADRADLVDRERLAALVHREAVTVVFQTPGALYRLLPPYLRQLGGERSRLRYVVLGGEALSWARLARLVAGAPHLDTVFVNMYGITEGTIHCTIVAAPAAELARVREGDVGVPLPSARCYVLDEQLRPTGVDVPGELYCGGVLVAHGYVDNPELTAARFLPDPYGRGVMYRTGDVVKWGTDGTMVYLGRNDTQVQLRGYRVELAEVEGAFLTHPAVRSCAVAAEDDQLVAFVVGGTGPDTERELRGHVRRTLPAYMVPARILTVETIPLTAHGKVDTARLLAETRAARTAAAPAPAADRATGTDLQERVRACWSEVLGRSDVGLHDNFFDLGGHSFALITLQQRLADDGLEVSVTDLFRAGTVAGCAAHLREAAPVLADARVTQRHQGRALLAGRRRGAGGGRG